MKSQLECTFVKKSNLSNDDRKKGIIDKFLRGKISDKQLMLMLENFKPKQLKPDTELSGYV